MLMFLSYVSQPVKLLLRHVPSPTFILRTCRFHLRTAARVRTWGQALCNLFLGGRTPFQAEPLSF